MRVTSSWPIMASIRLRFLPPLHSPNVSANYPVTLHYTGHVIVPPTVTYILWSHSPRSPLSLLSRRPYWLLSTTLSPSFSLSYRFLSTTGTFAVVWLLAPSVTRSSLYSLLFKCSSPFQSPLSLVPLTCSLLSSCVLPLQHFRPPACTRLAGCSS